MTAHRTRLTRLDLVLGLLLAAALFWLVNRLSTGVEYRWNWAAIPQYLIRYDRESGRWVASLLMQGFLTTVRLSLWGTLLAVAIGTFMGLARVSRSPLNRLLSRAYVELSRNIPPLVLIFIFYYFVSDQILPALGIEALVAEAGPGTRDAIALLLAPPDLLVPFLSALITLAIFEGAFITEIVRAGIQSIERGQWEASSALGMTRGQQMRHVVMPQAVERILPPMAGQFVSTIKDSAIVSVISIQELTFQGLELMSSTYLTFEIWITVTLLYLVLTLPCSLAVQTVERRLRLRRT